MKRIKTTRRTNLAAPMGQGVAFANSTHSLHGAPFNGAQWYTVGMLSGDDRDQFAADVESIDYLVYSYDTPIAWHTPDGWHLVTQKFSVTTSCHQGQVRRAMTWTPDGVRAQLAPRTVICAPSPAVLSELMRMA